MNKKYLLLAGLLPLFYSCNKSGKVTTMNYQSSPIAINEDDPSNEACTVMYVGKNLSTNGKAIIARSGDSSPNAMNLNMTIFNHNVLANKVVDSKNGFTYKMPATTYRYISTPRNRVINKGHHWEVSAINEKGVGVTATLSCYSKPEIVGEGGFDPLVPTGIGEDNITQIVGATATTAREGIQIIANIIDKQGACDCNAIMTVDQSEAWYMEIYSGHQYAAVKMPDNKILTAGNEFVFDSLKAMGIKRDDAILSENLLTKIPETKREPENCNDVMDLNLFGTYAKPLTDEESGRAVNDNCHRRTWRGYNLFAKEKYPDYQTYNSIIKYPAFYEINDGTKLDIHSVKTFMRDRFEDILENEDNPNYSDFKKDYDDHVLRYIGIETAYQIHVIQSNPDLPKYIAATEWVSMSNANYTPFVPISNGVYSLPDYYTKVSDVYGYDEKSAANIFKKLNTLARVDRPNYGIYVQEFWESYEKIWDTEYSQLMDKIKSFDIDTRCDYISNYINKTLNNVIKTALFMIDDLTWHMMSDQSSTADPTPFKPCVNVKNYAHTYGYSYEKINKTIKLSKGSEKYSLVLTSEEYPGSGKDYRSHGKISYGDVEEDIDMVIKDYDVYVPLENLAKYIKGDINLNINDYKTPFNHMVWIIPVTIVVPIIGGLVFHFVNKKRKEDR
ncbi:MAG: C69 family dipeptidase [Bacilli bacterium]|nr:C69 family dipeptidase [Bacilli bacterium]